ncbi:MAG: serine/threonine protein kinase [Synergistes sp.]|nr:serine/threonine protein kinase [Synergistes sp.]
MIITVGSIVKDDSGKTYVLDESIGSGGFGSVFKAHCEQNTNIVAIKVLQNSFDSDESYLTFQKETNQAKLLSSENVIKYMYIHDGKEFSEYPPYIIMEYTDGGTLRDLIKHQDGKQFDIEILKNIYLQLANGMNCISEHLVHRDIKPENILNFNGVLKITDFGISKISEESTKTLTFKNSGTPYYIAPEAWNGDKNTIQMDIYSMGIVFYELATLAYPYKIPIKTDYSSIRDMHLYNSPIKPTSINGNLPPNIVSIIIKMIEKPTQRRFKNWDEIIGALEVEAQPRDDLSVFVNRAVSLRNDKDLQLQKQLAEKKKAEEERENHIRLAYAQYVNTVSLPIREFAERFNSQYPHEKSICIKESNPSCSSSPNFSTTVMMPSGCDIKIIGKILFREQFIRSEQTVFDEAPKMVNYIPQCNNRDIILWCKVADTECLGFNLLLLKNNDSIYGDWYILENSTNAFTRTYRPSPFGFELSELPKEINNIGAIYYYKMDLNPLSRSKLLEYISDRV